MKISALLLKLIEDQLSFLLFIPKMKRQNSVDNVGGFNGLCSSVHEGGSGAKIL